MPLSSAGIAQQRNGAALMITIARPDLHDFFIVGLAVLFGAGLSGILFLVGMFFSTQWVEWRLRHGYYLDRRGRPRRGISEAPDMQLVRLDPANIWEMRAYREPVDVAKPLRAMTLPYAVVGLVTVTGRHAHVSMVLAKEKISRKAYRSLKVQLRYKGVQRITYERHALDGQVREIDGAA